MNAFEEFEKREAEISPDIATALKALGNEAITAYASVGLHHNTLSRLVPSILQNGLVADDPKAVPEQADVEFAAELYEAKGFRYPASQRQFDILIKGTREDREPGIFFYPLAADAAEFRVGYGVPERMHVLALEMGCLMLQENGPYTTEERQKARTIFERYRDIIEGDTDAHVAVLKANPFNPTIINHRLSRLGLLSRGRTTEDVNKWLKSLGYSEWEGIYIPGSVPPEDLELMDAKLPILSDLKEINLSPARSRFFYTPPGLIRQ